LNFDFDGGAFYSRWKKNASARGVRFFNSVKNPDLPEVFHAARQVLNGCRLRVVVNLGGEL